MAGDGLTALSEGVYLEMRDVADIVGKSTEATRKWLRRNNAAVKRGGRWVTTRHMLREAFPEVYQEIADREDY